MMSGCHWTEQGCDFRFSPCSTALELSAGMVSPEIQQMLVCLLQAEADAKDSRRMPRGSDRTEKPPGNWPGTKTDRLSGYFQEDVNAPTQRSSGDSEAPTICFGAVLHHINWTWATKRCLGFSCFSS